MAVGLLIYASSGFATDNTLLPCTTDLDCSLNGVCSGGSCRCDPPWKNAITEACSVLDVLSHPNDYVPAYGGPRTSTAYHPQNLTSWGGNILLGEDGQYHLYVSVMGGGAGLNGWTSVSQIDHGVAADPMEVFTRADTPLPKEAHNASPVRAKNGSILLFHIGDSGGAVGSSAFAHHAESPEGPWYPLKGPRCNNPAPMVAANGTTYVGCNNGGFTIFRSDDVFGGDDWAEVTKMAFPPSWGTGALAPYLKNEDPYLWMDTRGNFHLLAHRYDYRDGYPCNPNQTEPLLVSGHGFSVDGIDWHFNVEQQPYDAVVTFANGTVQQFSTFERPHLLFDKTSGRPTHLVTAAQPYWMGPRGPCDGCSARPGSEHSCVVCKTTPGIDYTYTLVSKLNA